MNKLEKICNYYEKILEINPKDPNANAEFREKLKNTALDKLKELKQK